MSKLHKRGQFSSNAKRWLFRLAASKLSLWMWGILLKIYYLLLLKTRGFVIKCIINRQLVTFSILFWFYSCKISKNSTWKIWSKPTNPIHVKRTKKELYNFLNQISQDAWCRNSKSFQCPTKASETCTIWCPQSWRNCKFSLMPFIQCFLKKKLKKKYNVWAKSCESGLTEFIRIIFYRHALSG